MRKVDHPTLVGWTIPVLWGNLVLGGQGMKLPGSASPRSAGERKTGDEGEEFGKKS